MRDSLKLESVLFDDAAVVDTSVDSRTDVSQFFHGMWIEIVVALVALCMYLWNSKRVSAGTQARKAPKSGQQRRPQEKSRNKASFSSQIIGSLPWSDESRKVQRFVASLLQKGQKLNPGVLLEQYEELVDLCGSSLRKHVTDDRNAHSMYVALIGYAAALPANAWVPTPRIPRAARDSFSVAWRWCERLLDDMRALGFPRGAEFYASVLKVFASRQLYQECLLLYEAILEDGAVPNNTMFIGLLNSAIACGESAKAFLFFEEVAKHSPPSLRTIMTVLRVHTSTKDWRGAGKLLERMESLGTPPDNLVLNNVLGLCVSVGEVDGAEQLLRRWMSIVDVISCNILLKGCAQQANLMKARALLDRMIAEGPTPNLISYNTVMDCAVRNIQNLIGDKPVQGRGGRDVPGAGPGRPSRDQSAMARWPWEILDQLSAQGLEPDRYTCSTLVKGMHLVGCSIADIDRAVDLLKRIGPDALQSPVANAGASVGNGCNARLLEVLFNTLLDACITCRDLDRMAQIFTMMQEFSVSVSAVTYGTLIKAFGQAGHLARCHEVWQDMQRARVQPSIVTYGCYIDACVRNEELVRAEEMFESMSNGSCGVRPNAVIYTSLIRGFAHSKQPRKALEFYRRMQQEGIEATSVTFNSVLDVVSRQLADPSTLQEVIADMSKANVAPDVVTYSILLKASCSSGDVQSALSLYKQIQSSGLTFDQVALNTLLLACSKADLVADAENVFDEMLRVGMKPTSVTTSIMVKMYGKAKMLDKAISVSARMEDFGQTPNLHVFTCLIQACVQNKQVRRSWDIFNKMAEVGVEPDAITYGSVIHGCVYLNKLQYAMSLVRHAHKRPRSPSDDADSPFDFNVPVKKAAPLQREVLQLLMSALRRKEQIALAAELEEIMEDCTHTGSEKPHFTKTGKRRGNGPT